MKEPGEFRKVRPYLKSKAVPFGIEALLAISIWAVAVTFTTPENSRAVAPGGALSSGGLSYQIDVKIGPKIVCSTGKHEFETMDELCTALLDNESNSGCGLAERIVYHKKICSGRSEILTSHEWINEEEKSFFSCQIKENGKVVADNKSDGTDMTVKHAGSIFSLATKRSHLMGEHNENYFSMAADLYNRITNTTLVGQQIGFEDASRASFSYYLPEKKVAYECQRDLKDNKHFSLATRVSKTHMNCYFKNASDQEFSLRSQSGHGELKSANKFGDFVMKASHGIVIDKAVAKIHLAMELFRGNKLVEKTEGVTDGDHIALGLHNRKFDEVFHGNCFVTLD